MTDIQLSRMQTWAPTKDNALVWESQDMARRAEKVTIKTEKGLTQATELLAVVKGKLSEAKQEYKDAMAPVNEKLVDPLKAFYKPIIDRLTKAEGMFKRAIGEYSLRVTRERRELIEALKSEGVEQKELAQFQPDKQESVVKGDGGSAVVSTTWEFTIEDTSLIPQDIKDEALNTKRGLEALDQAIRARVKGGARTIPGVAIYEGRSVSVKLTRDE